MTVLISEELNLMELLMGDALVNARAQAYI
jgi:hypothetical protein